MQHSAAPFRGSCWSNLRTLRGGLSPPGFTLRGFSSEHLSDVAVPGLGPSASFGELSPELETEGLSVLLAVASLRGRLRAGEQGPLPSGDSRPVPHGTGCPPRASPSGVRGALIAGSFVQMSPEPPCRSLPSGSPRAGRLPGPLPGAASRAASIRVPLGRGPPSGGALPRRLYRRHVCGVLLREISAHIPMGGSTESRSPGDLRRLPKPETSVSSRRWQHRATGVAKADDGHTDLRTDTKISRCSHREESRLSFASSGPAAPHDDRYGRMSADACRVTVPYRSGSSDLPSAGASARQLPNA